jgi:hypothetical protein
VTYTSSATGVATVNSSTGALTPGGTIGTNTTITATATGNYSGTATYTIKANAKVANYAYTGSIKSVTLPAGTYKMECWGAQSGANPQGGAAAPGRGAYVAGNIALTASTTLYVVVGSKGQSSTTVLNDAGGYNGGGTGGSNGIGIRNCSGGGGATDIRLNNAGVLNLTSLRSRIMVAAGGGGCGGGKFNTADHENSCPGGYAGGLTGGYVVPSITYTNSTNTVTAGSQTAGGTSVYSGHDIGQSNYAGSFGYAFQGEHTAYGGGGGGGWYGGARGYGTGGSGGSSFISGHSGCNPVNTSTGAHLGAGKKTTYNNVTYTFTSITMIDGAGYNWPSNSSSRGSLSTMPNPNGGNFASGYGNTGDGYARITWVSN